FVVKHEHAERVGGAGTLHRVEEIAIHRRDEHLRLRAEALLHDVPKPRGDDDLAQRQPIGRVDARRVAVVEALEMLDEVELGAGPCRCLGHRMGGLPGGGDERVRVGQARGIPPRDPADAGAEAADPVRAPPPEGAVPGGPAPTRARALWPATLPGRSPPPPASRSAYVRMARTPPAIRRWGAKK